ncbi:MAG: glycosyltransferase family 9 protein [Candidatus Sumerlaeia bacterium]|nr:glycosyltransferase family 9 protein [Candidatus Sumerlaeia bacterium]
MSSSVPPVSSVLIVRLSAIGDVIHALPVVDALHRLLPEARIGWVVEELSAPLLDNHPHISQVYRVPKKRWKTQWRQLWSTEIRPFFQKIAEDQWDVALDLQGLSKSGLVAWGTGARRRIGFAGEDSREVNRLFMTERIQPRSSAIHVVQKNLELLRAFLPDQQESSLAEFDTRIANTRGVIHFPEEELARLRSLLKELGWDGESPLAALNPGAGWITKRWTPEHFGEIGRRLGRRSFAPLIFWGPGEEAYRDRISAVLTKEETPHLITPKTTVREMAGLISLCSFFIGGDTGPTHLAGMFGVPTVALFGASDPERNRPWPVESSTVVQKAELSCVPCWKRECPLADSQHLQCLHTLGVAEVWDACEQILAERTAR